MQAWLSTISPSHSLTRLVKRYPLDSAAFVEEVEDVRVAGQEPGEGSSHADRNASADGFNCLRQSRADEHAQEQDVSLPRFHFS